MKIAWVDVTSGGACTKYLVNVASSKDVAVAGDGGVSVCVKNVNRFIFILCFTSRIPKLWICV